MLLEKPSSAASESREKKLWKSGIFWILKICSKKSPIYYAAALQEVVFMPACLDFHLFPIKFIRLIHVLVSQECLMLFTQLAAGFKAPVKFL